MVDEFDPIVLADLVAHIYEAAADDGHWHEMAAILERFYPGSRITLFGYDRKDPSRGLAVSRNFRADDMQVRPEPVGERSAPARHADRRVRNGGHLAGRILRGG